MITRLHRAWQRRAARWFGRRSALIRPAVPLVSFSFDDFPASAFTNGGAILEEAGARGTYYVSLGLASRTIETGRMFDIDHIADLVARGHELGCHTHDHCPSWETSPSAFEASVERNRRAVTSLLGTAPMPTLSYPISYPRPDTKRRMSRRFRGCRGGGQTHNVGQTDLNYFKSVFIEQLRAEPTALRQLIDANASERGWLVFSTHDIDESPTRYGCTPLLLAELVRYAAASGSRILPVDAALQHSLNPC